MQKNSLIPAEVWKYDTESILEGLHNAIAHQNYKKDARILVIENMDSLKFENDGNFFDGDYKQYITGEKTPKSYRNPALVKAMVNKIEYLLKKLKIKGEIVNESKGKESIWMLGKS